MNTMYALLLTTMLGQTMYCSDIASTTEPSSESVQPEQREDRLTQFFVKSLLYNHATQNSTEENGHRVARWESALQENTTNDKPAHISEVSPEEHVIRQYTLSGIDTDTISLDAQFSQKATKEGLQGIRALEVAGQAAVSFMSDTFTRCTVQLRSNGTEENEGQEHWICRAKISKKELLEIVRNVKQNNQ